MIELPNRRQIAEAVADHYGLALAELRGQDRSRRVSWPRQEAMVLMLAHGFWSTTQVGQFFGRDHTTVIHARRAYEKRLQAARG